MLACLWIVFTFVDELTATHYEREKSLYALKYETHVKKWITQGSSFGNKKKKAVSNNDRLANRTHRVFG